MADDDERDVKCPTCHKKVGELPKNPAAWYGAAIIILEKHFEKKPKCRP